jgi:hypothetical protein
MKKWFPEAVVGCAILMVVSYAFAQSWTQSDATLRTVWSITSSADGYKIMVCGSGSPIYSTNHGVTWTTKTNTPYNITDAVLSADGTTLMGWYRFGSWYFFVSTNFGDTWTQTSLPRTNWTTCASSADGTKLVAAGSSIYTSTDSGNTWQSNSAPNISWRAVASSADGTKLVAGGPGIFYTSTNSGLTWTPSNIGGDCVCSSADGSVLVALGRVGYSFISTNSGVSWHHTGINGGFVASSADGSKLVATTSPSIFGSGYICTSTNYGDSWTTNNLPYSTWTCVASSADGCELLAGNGGGTWISLTTPSPQLSAAVSSTNLSLSWLIPSTNFVVQQSPDLISWSSVTDAPALNLTNLNNELSFSPTNSSGFFRLMSQ